MFSYAYLRNNGYLLYKDMVHPYPPVLTLGLGILYKLFGYKLIVLKIVTWIIILINDILIFLIVKKLTNKNVFALLSLIFYLITQPFLDGNQLWFDLAIVPPILLATYCLLQKRYFWSGLFFGTAALTKQTSALFIIVSSLFIILKNKNFKNLFYFLAGPLILFLILLVRLMTEEAVSGFFNWTTIYPFTYWSKIPGYIEMALTNRQWFVVVLLSLPVFFLLFRKNYILYSVFYILTLVTVYPRFSFFHLQLAIAFSAVLFGIFLKNFRVSFLVPSAYCLVVFVFISIPILKTNWQKETRFLGENDLRLASVIKKETGNSVYLLGPHSALYVLSGELPPKPWADNFGWYFEIPEVQEETIRRWEQNPPEAVVWQEPLKGNQFDLGVYQPQKIVEWIGANYNKEKEIQSGIWLWRKK